MSSSMVTERMPVGPIVYGNELYQVTLNDGLTDEEQARAERILKWFIYKGQFFGVAGVMLVTAPPRSGKDTWANYLAWLCKRYYKNVRVIRDDHPQPAFGEYTYWDDNFLRADLQRMRAVAKAENSTGMDAKALSEKWIADKGEVMMKHAVVLFTEAWQKMSNRSPHDPVNRALGGLNKMWGHTETLYIYVAQWAHDLDRFTCLPWVNLHAKCMIDSNNPSRIIVHLYHVEFNFRKQELVVLDKRPEVIPINAARERSEMGVHHVDPDGTVHYNRVWDLFNSKSAPLLRMGGDPKKDMIGDL